LLGSLKRALAHRYSFEGSGDTAIDSVAETSGALFNVNLDDRGFVDLAGDNEFVNLPNGLLSSSNDKTIEAWLTWNGGDRWQRIFDFGTSDQGEAQRGNGTSYLYLTPRSTADVVLVGFSRAGYGAETRLSGTAALPVGRLSHVAVVIDSQTNAFSLFVDGALNATARLTERLSDVDDVNCWLGIAQFSGDPHLNAELNEFRLYERALTAEELELSFELGPDTAALTSP
jgi:hypothetical protein